MADEPGQAGPEVLSQLAATIAERAADASAGTSYTAKLLHAGTPKCAQKLGEEAVETVIAACSGDRRAVVTETADLLYHLLVLYRSLDLDIDDAFAELKRREGTGGLQEKAARKRS